MIQRDLWGDIVEEQKPGTGLLLADFNNYSIRIVMIAGEPWWVLTDVARVLGYRDSANAGRVLRSKHKGTHSVSTLGGPQEMAIINEPGLYRLMMRSDHPEAEAFQDWVTDEVLPSIRKSGTYKSKKGHLPKLARKLRTSDPEVMVARLDQIDLNKALNHQLAAECAIPNDFQAWHDAVYEGQFGKRAREIRKALRMKGYQSPLDRMGGLALVHNRHAKYLARQIIRDRAAELGRPLTIEEQVEILRDTAASIRDHDFGRLGFDAVAYNVIDDIERGPIIDVVRQLPPPE